MSTATETRPGALARIRTELEAAEAIAAKAAGEDRDLTETERAAVMAHVGKARDLRTEAELEKAVADFGAEAAMLDPSRGKAIAEAAGTTLDPAPSLGDAFVKSDQWRSYVAGHNGNFGEKSRVHSPALDFGGLKGLGYRPTGAGPQSAKALVTGASATSAGALVVADDLGLQDSGLYARPLTILDAMTRGTTTSDTVEYARETTVTNAAAPVPEATQVAHVGDEAATKPESAYALERVSEPVKTIAHWIPATKRALSDAAQVRTLIDAFLRYGLAEELEDQIITGDGTGENFTGLLNVAGVQNQAWFNGTGTNGDEANLLWTTRKALTLVRTVGRAVPNAFVFHPDDTERLDLIVDGNQRFYFDGPRAGGVQTLWRVPVIESEAVPTGQGLVGDWRRAVIWDREQAAIMASDQHSDFFIRNLVAILAEMRAAFGVIRPSAFVIIDLTAL